MAKRADRSVRSRSTATIIALIAITSACSDAGSPNGMGGHEDAQPVRGGTLVIAGPNDLGGMNGLTATESYTQDLLLHALFLPLLSLGEHGRFEPALARDWQWEGDTAITFALRTDVRWHDGRPTTAMDVAFTFERATDPRTGYPGIEDFTAWSGVTIVDSFTVRFAVRPHVEPLIGLAFLPIMPAHALDSIAPAQLGQAAFNRAPVGNGPFRFVEYRPNERWIFEANPDYPMDLGGPPLLDRIVWRVIPENTAQIAELMTGGAHLILSPRADDLAAIEAQPGLRAIVKPARQYHFIGWNGRAGALSRPEVRRALTMAIDRGRILAVMRGGRGRLAAGPIAPFHWAFPDSITPLPHDTAEARILLASAGITDRNGDGWLERPDGKPFRVQLKIAASNAFNRDVAEVMQADLAAIGVGLDIMPVEFGTLIGDISSAERNFEAVLMGWEADFRINLRDTFHSNALGGPFQLASYSNPELDALLDRLDGVRDRHEATPLWHTVQRIMRDEQPWTFLWYVPSLYAADRRLMDAVMDERGTFIDLHQWWLTPAD
jgi:peptide/nickel transport system substrate-binding protein